MICGTSATRRGARTKDYELGAVTQTRTTNSTIASARPNPHIISSRAPLRSPSGKSSMRPNISWRGSSWRGKSSMCCGAMACLLIAFQVLHGVLDDLELNHEHHHAVRRSHDRQKNDDRGVDAALRAMFSGEVSAHPVVE